LGILVKVEAGKRWSIAGDGVSQVEAKWCKNQPIGIWHRCQGRKKIVLAIYSWVCQSFIRIDIGGET
jgi:hypothetical protein